MVFEIQITRCMEDLLPWGRGGESNTKCMSESVQLEGKSEGGRGGGEFSLAWEIPGYPTLCVKKHNSNSKSSETVYVIETVHCYYFPNIYWQKSHTTTITYLYMSFQSRWVTYVNHSMNRWIIEYTSAVTDTMSHEIAVKKKTSPGQVEQYYMHSFVHIVYYKHARLLIL